MLIFRIGLQDIEKMKIMLNERHFPSEIPLFKVNNRNTRNFEHISHLFLLFLLLTLNK